MKDFKRKDFKESNEYQMIFRSAETLISDKKFSLVYTLVCLLPLVYWTSDFLPRLYRILKQFLVQLLSLWGRFHRYVNLTILKKFWLSRTYCICTMGYVFNLGLINWKKENCGIIFIHGGVCESPENLKKA